MDGSKSIGKIIAIEGNISSGKSTVLKMFPPSFKRIKDIAIDTAMLGKFYSGECTPEEFQTYLVTKRYEVYQEAISQTLKGYNVVIDQSIYSDFAFWGCLKDKKLKKKHIKKYNLFLNECKFHKPIVIMLSTPIEVLTTRIATRGRECEQGIPLSYLQLLKSRYLTLAKKLSKETIVYLWDSTSITTLQSKVENFCKMCDVQNPLTVTCKIN